ncbi:MAG: hypothetical protein RLY31_94 [Bacteroidota bacterium]
MVTQYHGRYFSTAQLRQLVRQTSEGSTLLDLSEAAEAIGMHTVGARLTYDRLADDIPLPGIVHWRGNHFIVVVEVHANTAVVADPENDALETVSQAYFMEQWIGPDASPASEGIVLLMEPTADFHGNPDKQAASVRPGFLWRRFLSHPRLFVFLLAAMVIGTLLSAVAPLLLRTMVDESVARQDLDVLRIVFIAWIWLYTCQAGLEVVRRLLLFHLGAKVNIKLLTTYLKRLLAMPLSFFQVRQSEDVVQTLLDTGRLYRFLTRESLALLQTSLLTLLYGGLLLAVSGKLFLVYALTAFLQGLALWYFLRRREKGQNIRQDLAASRYGQLTDMVRGIKDIKLANAERNLRWSWERTEARLFQSSRSKVLSEELSMMIPYYLGELRNILVIYLAAQMMVAGLVSAGGLVAVIFILTQLNNPLRQLIAYFIGWQEVKPRLERMEEVGGQVVSESDLKLDVLPEEGELVLERVSFQYEGGKRPWVFQEFHARIPKRKVTVIVGPSGSGKSTLLNLLLNFMQPQEGIVKFGGVKLTDLDHAAWLARCGVVPQDGHLFQGSIAQNIALGSDVIDQNHLLEAALLANLLPMLEHLPHGFQTVIGEGGTGLSKGQRQSVLIARAIYQNPAILFLDEATNDLDPESEELVLERIVQAFQHRTVVIFSSRPQLPVRFDHVITLGNLVRR